jgi:hypothetical protein
MATTNKGVELRCADCGAGLDPIDADWRDPANGIPTTGEDCAPFCAPCAPSEGAMVRARVKAA